MKPREVSNPVLDHVVTTNFDLFLTYLNGKVGCRDYFPAGYWAGTNFRPI